MKIMLVGLSEERVITTVQLTISVQGLSVHVSCMQAWVASQNSHHTEGLHLTAQKSWDCLAFTEHTTGQQKCP